MTRILALLFIFAVIEYTTLKSIIFTIWLLVFSQALFSQQDSMPASDTSEVNSITNKTFEIQAVEVRAILSNANIKSGSTGLMLDVKELKKLPNLLGESDPYKALQYMGGVSQAGEASSGLYVRGGNNDQNLILLNGTQIQNPTHVLGLFSVFNPDLFDQMKFIKTGIPAEYGGRLSAVVDISNSHYIPDKFKIDGSVGLISSRLSLQSPIGKNTSAYASWRGSYLNLTVFPFLSIMGVSELLTGNNINFWDVNLGFTHRMSGNTRISSHFYTGYDNISLGVFKNHNLDENTSYWNNTAAGLQLNHIFSEHWSMNHQLNYSDFNLESAFTWYNSKQQLSSSNRIFNYKADFVYIQEQHNAKFGGEMAYNMTYPHFIKSDSIIPIEIDNKHNDIFSTHLVLYGRDEWEWNNWQFNIGLRINLYSQLGPYNDFQDDGLIVPYKQNEFVMDYLNLEPRFFGRYLLNDNSSLKFSAGRYMQYMSQIPVINVGVPIDLQIAAGLHVKPQISWHYSAGYFKNFRDNEWEMSVEIYYKTLQNQLEFKSGITEVFTNTMLEKNVLTGRGWSYGAEYKLGRNLGKFTGWLSYNLAWSYRQFDEINQGRPYLSHNDRRHDLSLVGMYRLNDSWNFSATFVYATGNRLNLPLSWYIINNQVILEYGRYNAFEKPAYHRLDISASHKLKPFWKIRSELNFSVYNVYNRANPYQILYHTSLEDGQYAFKVKMSYLMPIIPSISWVFHL